MARTPDSMYIYELLYHFMRLDQHKKVKSKQTQKRKLV